MNKPQTRRIRRCQCQACRAHRYSRVAQEHRAINRVLAGLDEKSRRRFAGLLALRLGRGGVQRVHEITGLSRTTIGVGQAELRRTDRVKGVRRAGGGRPAVEKSVPAS
jgi:hypothetical protein